jgi:hypothetical protein
VSASQALTQAIIAALNADAAIGAAVNGVFDAPPPGAVPPYLTVGTDLVRDASSFVTEGREHRVRVVVWDAPLRAERCAATLAAVEAVLAALDPALGGYAITAMRFAASAVAAERPGGPTRGVVDFNARTMATGV